MKEEFLSWLYANTSSLDNEEKLGLFILGQKYLTSLKLQLKNIHLYSL